MGINELTARLTDIAVGICCCHPPIPCVPWVGVIIKGSSNTNTNNLQTARCTDPVLGCHVGTICTCSRTVMANNNGVARRTDRVCGCPKGVIVTGSIDTITSS